MNIKSDNWKEKLATDGYVIIDNFLTQSQVKTLSEFYFTSVPTDLSKRALSFSQLSSDTVYRQKVFLTVKKTFREKVNSLLPEYRIANAFFLTKRAQTNNNQLKMHQDTPMIDERYYNHYHVWCPLINTTHHNGCLKIVRGSHKLKRFSLSGNTLIEPKYETMMEDYTISLPMKAGQALIFDVRTLHGSFPNRSKQERISAVADLVPSQAQLIYYYPDNTFSPKNIEVFEVDDNFFKDFIFTNKNMSEEMFRPNNLKNIAQIKYDKPSFTKEEIWNGLNTNPLNTKLSWLQKLKVNTKLLGLKLKNKY